MIVCVGVRRYLVLEDFTVLWTAGGTAPRYPVDVTSLKPIEGRKASKDMGASTQCSPKGSKRLSQAGVAAGVCTVPEGFTFKDGVVNPGPDPRIETKKAQIQQQYEQQQWQQHQRSQQYKQQHRKEYVHKNRYGASGSGGRQVPARKNHEAANSVPPFYGEQRSERHSGYPPKSHQNGPYSDQISAQKYQPVRPPPPQQAQYQQQGAPHHQAHMWQDAKCTQQVRNIGAQSIVLFT